MPSILSAVRDLNRLRQIYIVLVRHGFGEVAQRLGIARRAKPRPPTGGSAPPSSAPPPAGVDLPVVTVGAEDLAEGETAAREHSLAERVRLVAIDLGPSFVKLGQIASTRPDLFPEDWIRELKQLQDSVPPLPFEDIRQAVEASLTAPIDEMFEHFDETPLAAASIGQVHRARLRYASGAVEVVVKVQRPNVRDTVARDLELLHTLAKVVERTIPESRIYSPSALVEQFDRAITAELDFKLEADNAERFRRNFAGHPAARFPRIYREASTKEVLTLELLPGTKVYQAIAEHGHHGPTLAKTSVGIIIKMIFEDGFFHADPHPGNILIAGTPEAPHIGLIDLGMVGRLSPDLREKTVDLMIAAIRQDHVAVADALYAIGTPTQKIDLRAYRADVSLLAEKYLGRPLKEIDFSAMIADLVKGATKYGLEIPPDFLLVGKTLMTIEGVGKEIDPDLDVYSEARPFFFDLLRKRYSPQRMGNEIWRGLEKLSGAAYDMPQLVREVLDDLRLGRIGVQATEPTLRGSLDRLGARLRTGLVVLGLAIAGAMLARSADRAIGLGMLGAAGALLVAHLVRDATRKG